MISLLFKYRIVFKVGIMRSGKLLSTSMCLTFYNERGERLVQLKPRPSPKPSPARLTPPDMNISLLQRAPSSLARYFCKLPERRQGLHSLPRFLMFVGGII